MLTDAVCAGLAHLPQVKAEEVLRQVDILFYFLCGLIIHKINNEGVWVGRWGQVGALEVRRHLQIPASTAAADQLPTYAMALHRTFGEHAP